MDVKDILNQPSSILDISKKAKKSEPGELSFQELLKDAHSKSTGPSQTFSTSTATGVEIPSEAVLSISPSNALLEIESIDQIRSQGIQATENALVILEEYQRNMADPRVPLKKIDPLIQSLSQEVHTLNTLSEKLPPSDPLQKILTELGIVSTVEIEKFNRGEYV